MCVFADTNDLILRVAKDKPDQVFLAERNSARIYQSLDKGQTWININPGSLITDFQVATINNVLTIFLLSDGNVRKGEFNGTFWKWGPIENTGLAVGHTIAVAPSGEVVVGDGGQGLVAYSKNELTQFVTLPPLPVQGDVHVTVDNRMSSLVIYAATDQTDSGIYSWIGSGKWISMCPPRQCYFGIARSTLFTDVGQVAVKAELPGH